MKETNVTSVVRHKVKVQFGSEYEDWLHRISEVALQAKGSLGLHIIRPTIGGSEYTILLRWETFDDGKHWAASEPRKNLISEAMQWQVSPDCVEIGNGINYWITPNQKDPPKAARWKQWLVSTSVIWPLSMLVQVAFEPLFMSFPFLRLWPVGPFLVVALTVWLVTFIVMPRLVTAIAPWLYRH